MLTTSSQSPPIPLLQGPQNPPPTHTPFPPLNMLVRAAVGESFLKSMDKESQVSRSQLMHLNSSKYGKRRVISLLVCI